MVVVLIFIKRNKFCDAGVLIILEIETEYLFENIARAELLGVDRKHASILRAKLRVKVHSYRNALYLTHPLCKLTQFFVELAVIIAFGKLVYTVTQSAERPAVQ